MYRHLGGAMLVALGILLGWAFNFSFHSTHAAAQPPTTVDADVDVEEDRTGQEIIVQLKKINGRLEKIDTLLQSGTLRVVNVIHPDVEE